MDRGPEPCCQEISVSETLHRTALHDEHLRLAARMVAFAGYAMPVQYSTGVLTEHNWTRQQVGDRKSVV